MKRTIRLCFSITLGTMIALGAALPAEAGKRVRSSSRTNVNKNKNVNRNSNKNVNVNSNRNVNKNVNVNVNVDHRGGYHGGCCYDPHPVARVAGVVATAVIIGSIVNTLPTGCSTVIVNGFAYQQCGSTWYQPQIAGSTTTYVVVNHPY